MLKYFFLADADGRRVTNCTAQVMKSFSHFPTVGEIKAISDPLLKDVDFNNFGSEYLEPCRFAIERAILKLLKNPIDDPQPHCSWLCKGIVMCIWIRETK